MHRNVRRLDIGRRLGRVSNNFSFEGTIASKIIANWFGGVAEIPILHNMRLSSFGAYIQELGLQAFGRSLSLG